MPWRHSIARVEHAVLGHNADPPRCREKWVELGRSAVAENEYPARIEIGDLTSNILWLVGQRPW
jgi:hypothetical protein